MDHVKYIDRTREYYLAQGYDKPYSWAHFDQVPFTPLNKPLSECKIALVSTSDIAVRGEEDPDHESMAFQVGNVYSIATETPIEKLYSSQENYDVHATTLDDPNSFYPVSRLKEAAAEGMIASFSDRAHGVHTAYSHRRTLETDAPEVLKRCREDGTDAVVLTPVCPVCHQTVSLVSRFLEENGIPTVVIGSARDIVEHCGVARQVFTDFPLGNPCGEPFDIEGQRKIVTSALRLLEDATEPRTTIQSPLTWSKGERWKELIFTAEQPFLQGEAKEKWMKAKEKYKEMKSAGEV